jgi:hypothetical protein
LLTVVESKWLIAVGIDVGAKRSVVGIGCCDRLLLVLKRQAICCTASTTRQGASLVVVVVTLKVEASKKSDRKL